MNLRRALVKLLDPNAYNLRVEIDHQLGSPKTCKVYYQDRLVFDGVDRTVLAVEGEKP